MTNQEIDIARRFHEATKYRPIQSPDRVPMMGIPPGLKPAAGEQDPANEPHLFKTYTSLEGLELPHEFTPSDLSLLEAIAAPGGIVAGGDLHQGVSTHRATPDRATLAHISLLSNGIHKHSGHVGTVGYETTRRPFQYRAAGCTGGLYHLELYFVCGELADLDAGLYHYAADSHTFRQIRTGDYRATIVEATGNEPATATAPVLLIVTSTFWRNAWRYLERAYRHTFWDLGTLLAHVLAIAAAEELPAKVVMGFNDDLVNQVLDVDGKREAAVCIVPLGAGDQPGSAPEVVPTGHAVAPVSSSELDFPLIWDMHAASSLYSSTEVATWRTQRIGQRAEADAGAPASVEINLRPLSGAALPDMPVDEAIERRRSTRHYDVDTPLPFDLFSTLLERSMHPIAFDCLNPAAGPLTDPYLIVNNVAGLEAGSYVLHKDRASLEQIEAGDFRQAARTLALGQGYPGDAHVNLYFLADLEQVLEQYGNRGYRMAQLEGAIRGGKLQLATHALGLGTVGTTSLDDGVIDFFGPAAASKSYMFAIVFGNRRKRLK